MTLPVVWTSEANEDLLEARAWYDNIRTQLGDRFAGMVEATVEAIAEHPSQFPVVPESSPRGSAPISLRNQNRIVVLACFHSRRNPRHWHLR